jgi:hypothetical protein
MVQQKNMNLQNLGSKILNMKQGMLLFLFLTISVLVRSKQKFGLDLGIGLKAGMTLNHVNGYGWQDVYKVNPNAGFFANLNKRRIGIQVEALWSQSTMVTDTSFYGVYAQFYRNIEDSLINGSFKFQTIAIPILVNLKLTQFLWIQLGPQFSSNVSVLDKNKILKSGIEVISQNSYDVIGGLWVQFGGKSSLLRVNAGIRYIWGISNINNLIRERSWTNQMIQLHVGISY